MNIRIAGMIEESIVDGPGIRYVVFTQGCPHKCFGCHNPSTHDFNKGYIIDTSAIIQKMNMNPLLSGLTISGGEPFLQVEECLDLVKHVNHSSHNIIVYTGYTFEYLVEKSRNDIHLWKLLTNIDYLIDGKYIESLRDLSLKYRGSLNQRIINIRKSIEDNQIILEEL